MCVEREQVRERVHMVHMVQQSVCVQQKRKDIQNYQRKTSNNNTTNNSTTYRVHLIPTMLQFFRFHLNKYQLLSYRHLGFECNFDVQLVN